jgi:non-ribosomal peptide synthetase component E (peptide arylation enzyme)
MAKPTRLTREMIEDNIARRLWDRTSITDLLERHAESRPDAEAVVDTARRYSWSQLNRVVNAMAAGLMDLGLERDDAFVAQLPASTDTLIILLACQKAGILSCFSPMTFRHNDLKHVLKTLNAAAVITPLYYRKIAYHEMAKAIAGDLPALKHFIVTGEETPHSTISFTDLITPSRIPKDSNAYFKPFAFSPFDVSIVVLSSGSTGMPKCIEQLGASCKVGGWGLVERGKLTREDVFGIIAPLSGGPGLQNWWGALQLGAKVCLLEHFSAERALQLIQKERVTYLSAVPSQIIKILKEVDVSRYDLSSLRIVRTGASAFDAASARKAEEKLKCTVLIAGGSQETYSFAQTGVDDPPEKRTMTLGKPFPGNEVKICNEQGQPVSQGDTGHLRVRGAATSSGYFGDRETTLAAWGEFGPGGWYKTGDLAKIDEEGYVVLQGRQKEIIIRGGQNIYPKEIEDFLLTHPKILQAAVIGIPDLVMGERACACLTIVDGQDIVFEEMITFLKEKGLAVHKLPEALHVLDRFPQLVDGQKVNKLALKKMIIERMKKS